MNFLVHISEHNGIYYSEMENGKLCQFSYSKNNMANFEAFCKTIASSYDKYPNSEEWFFSKVQKRPWFNGLHGQSPNSALYKSEKVKFKKWYFMS